MAAALRSEESKLFPAEALILLGLAFLAGGFCAAPVCQAWASSMRPALLSVVVGRRPVIVAGTIVSRQAEGKTYDVVQVRIGEIIKNDGFDVTAADVRIVTNGMLSIWVNQAHRAKCEPGMAIVWMPRHHGGRFWADHIVYSLPKFGKEIRSFAKINTTGHLGSWRLSSDTLLAHAMQSLNTNLERLPAETRNEARKVAEGIARRIVVSVSASGSWSISPPRRWQENITMTTELFALLTGRSPDTEEARAFSRQYVYARSRRSGQWRQDTSGRITFSGSPKDGRGVIVVKGDEMVFYSDTTFLNQKFVRPKPSGQKK